MPVLFRKDSPCFAVIAAAGLVLLVPLSAQSQFVVSPRAGLISYTEGKVVLLNPTDEHGSPDLSNDVREGGRLSTKNGRTEMLLGPDRLLRLDRFTEIELLESDIADVQVRIVSGSVIFDLAKSPGKHSVAAFFDQAKIEFVKRGLYRVGVGLDGTAELSVLRGKTLVSLGGAEQEVSAKRAILLASGSSASEFDDMQGDRFHAWHRKRAKFISETRRHGRRLEVAMRRGKQKKLGIQGSALVAIPGVSPQRPVPEPNQ